MTMYNVKCTMYNVACLTHFTLYNVHFTLYIYFAIGSKRTAVS